MTLRRSLPHHFYAAFLVVIVLISPSASAAQTTARGAQLGSETAKNGFKNEDEIRDKFNAWRTDAEARSWLTAMSYRLPDIMEVIATKPHGEKADVEVIIKTRGGAHKEGISIKLVSTTHGFNQIDKRWLSHYVKMWKIPEDVTAALKLFVGEVPPSKTSRSPDRMFLNELEPAEQKAVIDFFTKNKEMIVSDLFSGDGDHAAGWVMVALKSTDTPHWVLRKDTDAIRFYSDGAVGLTRSGNLQIGRITMQRKGGDGGRETARMLQFKINPALLFDAK